MPIYPIERRGYGNICEKQIIRMFASLERKDKKRALTYTEEEITLYDRCKEQGVSKMKEKLYLLVIC